MRDIKTPEIGKVLPGIAGEAETGKMHVHRAKHRIFATPTAIILICLIVIGTAACAVPVIIDYLNADVLTENNTRLTKVPDGWIGIYTAEDLNNIRNYYITNEYDNKELNFIMMNDIIFTDADYAPGGICEGGWVPISTEGHERLQSDYFYREGFDGTFNGNGHIIRNLKINTGNETNYAGIFGFTTASFINLGIEGCEINVNRAINDDSKLYVGAIVGRAAFIGGCYASDVSICVNLETSEYHEQKLINRKIAGGDIINQKVFVGGLGGNVGYVDSCYTNTKININEIGDPVADIRIGGLAGASTSCVTSYFTGNINTDQSKFYCCKTDPITVSDVGSSLPVMISEEAMEKMMTICREYYGKDNFSYKKFCAYFLPKDPDQSTTPKARAEVEEMISRSIQKYYYTEDVSDIRSWYLFDPTASVEENDAIAQLIAEAFGDYDNFQQFCLENKIKCGILYCYSFEDGEKIKTSNLEGFNFDTIWVIKKGQALLKIFES